MTITSRIKSVQIVWPICDEPDEYACEHAIAVAPYVGSIEIEQAGRTINVPLYALRQVIAAMRTAGKDAGGL